MSIDISADAYDEAKFEPVISEEKIDQKQDWTNAQIKRVVLNIFIGLATFFTIGLLTYAITYSIAEMGALAILPAILTIGLIYWRCVIVDYDNPKELALIKQEALTLTFKQLYKKHGCENLCRYDILPIYELQKKFNLEIQTMNFDEVLGDFDTQELTNHGIISGQHGQFLTELKSYKKQIERQFNLKVADIDARYPRRTEKLRNQMNLAIGQLDRNNVPLFIPKAILDAAATHGREQQTAYDQALLDIKEWKIQSINDLNDQYSRYKINLMMEKS